MAKEFKTAKGHPSLGANADPAGTNFAIFSRNGKRVFLELFENFYDEKPVFTYELDHVRNKTGDIWHIYIFDVGEGYYYGWRIDGNYNPHHGDRFNSNKLLLDPYAKAISNTFDFDDPLQYGYKKEKSVFDSDTTFSELNSAKSMCKAIVVDDLNYEWGNDLHPKTPLKDTIIYEMHIRLFTMNPNSGVENRGTYDGLKQKISYLKDLGITAVELMPIFEFNINSNTNKNPINGEDLKELWGYNPLSFFAATGNYSHGLKLGEQIYQVKDLVKEFHNNGIEVYLDVVYNHTGEGNHMGPTLNYRGIDNTIYYILEKYNKRFYANYSGTGNTLNCSHAVVKQMILDSLRYWVTEVHIDGFRFDLAAVLGRDSKGNWIGDMSLLKDIADDPILYGTKLIAEGWDAAGGYFLGEFPQGWAEWNGKFRDAVRKFIKGDSGCVPEIATRISGSSDLFQKGERSPYHSVNFVTAHDGFTLWDLVSYNHKHNLANGENNNDGMNENDSYNNGFEGEVNDPKIIDKRKRLIRNYFTVMMVSQGIPMIYMGDEFCRTQYGNNNAYCQDTIINWVDWSRKEKFKDIYDFTKNVIHFRKNYEILRRSTFFEGKDYFGDGYADISWHGVKPFEPDWGGNSHTLAFLLNGNAVYNNGIEVPSVYVAMNSYHEQLLFEIPQLKGKKWYRVIDTYFSGESSFFDEPVEIGRVFNVKEQSIIVLISD